MTVVIISYCFVVVRIDGLAELEREVESIVTAPTLEGIKERMDAFEVMILGIFNQHSA